MTGYGCSQAGSAPVETLPKPTTGAGAYSKTRDSLAAALALQRAMTESSIAVAPSSDPPRSAPMSLAVLASPQPEFAPSARTFLGASSSTPDGCDALCIVGGKSATCREHMTYHLHHAFLRTENACVLAMDQVAQDCRPSCNGCVLNDVSCAALRTGKATTAQILGEKLVPLATQLYDAPEHRGQSLAPVASVVVAACLAFAAVAAVALLGLPVLMGWQARPHEALCPRHVGLVPSSWRLRTLGQRGIQLHLWAGEAEESAGFLYRREDGQNVHEEEPLCSLRLDET